MSRPLLNSDQNNYIGVCFLHQGKGLALSYSFQILNVNIQVGPRQHCQNKVFFQYIKIFSCIKPPTSCPAPGCDDSSISGGGPPYFLCPVVTSNEYPVLSRIS